MLIERERYVLGQIAAGVPLTQVLEDLLRAVEAQASGQMLTSILFLSEDGRHLRHGAAPSLPVAYNEAIDGITIGEGVGSCGTAATRGSAVYVSDINTDPLWKDFRDLALDHGLRACWSTPIKAADGSVLGTFAIYYSEPRTPTTADLDAIAFVTQTAALAIERHRSDLKLRRSQDELRALNAELEEQVAKRTAERNVLATMIESTDIMVMAVGLDYTILAINNANADEFERIYGVRPRAGDNMLELLAGQPDQQAQVRAAWGRGLAGEEVTVIEEYGDPDRVQPYYEIKFRTLRNECGERIGCYHFVTDVTERLREQAALAQAQEALRQSQKMEAVGQLTGGVAHDFNNLLTVIKSSTDLLKRPNLPEERRARYVAAISDTVDRAAKLTSQLLAFARRQALKPETFDAGQAVHVLSDMVRTLTGTRIEIITYLPDEPCFISADPSQFDTALINIVVNARDAMDGEGQITITVEPTETMPAVRRHAAIKAPYVAISIADTGSGIPSDQIDQIFEPFFTTKGVGHGTGLGLSQVFGFVKQSGGQVIVESEVGQGTTFTLYLPRVIAAPGVAAPEEETTEDGYGTCVLVVEDNRDVGTFVTQTLEELGYRTTWVENAQAALDKLAASPGAHDIVFSDVVMPGMNGVELARHVQRLYPDLPLILTSGYSHVLAEGGHGFELLQKPYSVEALSRVLRKASRKLRKRAQAK
ncbi:histidine kinase,PAS domain-containing protein,Response regulator receiver domain protein,histidine kinase,GAF domain-containing protein [Microvirga lotononidis]|uniref:histidine kinase n=2 Tax=Microvirga lotononidis TaxID=864069 RepID=I4YRG7_9HYPH|nr:histidine kinase,PAS domain-containing protein,Response regulator receiver domain protein,histidine kinase,GAF domain-containing protein [Microvirga lotononidis]